MEKRNWKIYFEWINGKDYNVLAEEFHLSTSTIKEICTSKIPDKIRQTYWQSANQYAKWRSYKRKTLKLSNGRELSTPDTSNGSV